jgi:hypothetical protein
MARLIVLDSGPLGLIVRAPGRPHVARCLTWLRTILATGAVVVIPDIAHYELRRELLRIRAVGSLQPYFPHISRRFSPEGVPILVEK